MRSEYDDYDLHCESMEERRQSRHWCSVCLGHTGPGSPCAIEPPEEPEVEAGPEGDEE